MIVTIVSELLSVNTTLDQISVGGESSNLISVVVNHKVQR